MRGTLQLTRKQPQHSLADGLQQKELCTNQMAAMAAHIEGAFWVVACMYKLSACHLQLLLLQKIYQAWYRVCTSGQHKVCTPGNITGCLHLIRSSGCCNDNTGGIGYAPGNKLSAFHQAQLLLLPI